MQGTALPSRNDMNETIADAHSFSTPSDPPLRDVLRVASKGFRTSSGVLLRYMRCGHLALVALGSGVQQSWVQPDCAADSRRHSSSMRHVLQRAAGACTDADRAGDETSLAALLGFRRGVHRPRTVPPPWPVSRHGEVRTAPAAKTQSPCRRPIRWVERRMRPGG
jgi:hypothetical protein